MYRVPQMNTYRLSVWYVCIQVNHWTLVIGLLGPVLFFLIEMDRLPSEKRHCCHMQFVEYILIWAAISLILFETIWAATWQNQQNECAPSENSDQSGSQVFFMRTAKKTWEPGWSVFFMRTAKTLIRLGGCPGWSESSLGAHSFVGFVMSRLICSADLFYTRITASPEFKYFMDPLRTFK